MPAHFADAVCERRATINGERGSIRVKDNQGTFEKDGRRGRSEPPRAYNAGVRNLTSDEINGINALY